MSATADGASLIEVETTVVTALGVPPLSEAIVNVVVSVAPAATRFCVGVNVSARIAA